MAQLNRKPLTVNPNRKTRKQEFNFNTDTISLILSK